MSNIRLSTTVLVAMVLGVVPGLGLAAELHVSPTGNDTNAGTPAAMLRTISAAASRAQPGDTITVHAGTYRERVDPPRGGTSDTNRITYQAAKGEKVVITGSEPVRGWQHVSDDTWKVTIPNKRFGAFNPFAEEIHGDWFSPNGRAHSRGCVFLNGNGLTEAGGLDAVMAKPGANPLWFATVDGVKLPAFPYLMNLAWFKPATGGEIPATRTAAREGTQNVPCSEGGDGVGYISHRNWLRFDGVDFGKGAQSIDFRATAQTGTGGTIEIRQGFFDGPLLGTCEVMPTGGWQNWATCPAKIRRTSGILSIYLVFKEPARDAAANEAATGNTEIHAQFPGADPNKSGVEISCRPTVFTPEKPGINFITVRGFELCNAATNWAAPTAGQRGLVSAYWCKGWIIEDNHIHHTRCSGIALGKYSDQWDGKRGSTEGYVLTIDDALKTGGWTQEQVGSHIVRRNHIHHCGQTGIVGGMGCAFSTIEGNDIHDIYWGEPFGGAEMACIKFHGAVDLLIRDNHLWRCANTGLWLDWMAQGAQITGNLIHDCNFMVINMEVNHGPNLIANNILLGSAMQLCGSNSNAYVHNLGTWKMWPNAPEDLRQTPFMKPHVTACAGHHSTPAASDDRVYNNIFDGQTDLRIYEKPLMPSWLAGNVYLKGSTAPNCEKDALALPQHDAQPKLTQKPDGWYLTITLDPAWRAARQRPLVTTAMLGMGAIAGQAFENPDGSAYRVDIDYFGHPRSPNNPFPGPFESVKDGKQEIKVWPK
jgi:alpha-N-arabinofuranosidase